MHSKIANHFCARYPILAPKSVSLPSLSRAPFQEISVAPPPPSALHHTALSPFTFLTPRADAGILGQPTGVNSRQVLGVRDMGAAPDRNEQRAAVSPLREFERRTTFNPSTRHKPGPKHFPRVPTHAFGVARERRQAPRAHLALPLRLTRVAGKAEPFPVTLVTKNISSSGVYFLAPRDFEPGTAIELEVALVERPLGMGTVQMCTAAHIVRCEESDTPGWRGYAASFDDFALRRDDVIPMRYRAL